SGTGIIVTGLMATLLAMIFPIWSYAGRSGTGLGVLHADQRHEVEAARFAFQQSWQMQTVGMPQRP
ncbi:hypothetical protein O3S80_46835, partial [Streptomyces sp. Lzd4kr]|nr:hypothetical protein [Streptomyces sp. Lzd4kr]